MKPREVPVEKPSAVQNYVPKVLLRPEERDTRRRWMPNERRPGASKHLLNQQQDVMKIKVDTEHCSEQELERLEELESEIAILENEMEKFVQEFYVAAATFSSQVTSQKTLIDRLRK